MTPNRSAYWALILGVVYSGVYLSSCFVQGRQPQLARAVQGYLVITGLVMLSPQVISLLRAAHAPEIRLLLGLGVFVAAWLAVTELWQIVNVR